MTCETAIELISAKLDGELTADQAAQLDRHLAQCSACRALLEELTAIHAACGGLEAAPPAALREQILQNLPAQKAAPRSGSEKVVFLHWRRWSAMAASFALIALAAWHLPKLAVSPAPGSATPPSQMERLDGGEDKTLQDAELPDPELDPAVVNVPETSPADLADLMPSPAALLPDSAKYDPVDVNAPQAAPASDHATGLQKTAKASGAAEFSTDSAVANEADTDATTTCAYQDATEESTPLPLLASARMTLSAAQKQAVFPDSKSAETEVLRVAAFDEELPERPAESAEGEDLLATSLPDNAVSPSYCGVLTLKDGGLLNSYPAQVQSNGETWYELPCAAFFALSEELKDSEADFSLRMTGADVSSSVQSGLVIVLP